MRNVMPPLRRLGANANKSTPAAGLHGENPPISQPPGMRNRPYHTG